MDEIKHAMILTQIKKVGATDGKPLRPQAPEKSGGPSFDQALDQAELQFSKHAEKRLQSRRIEISAGEKAKLGEALQTLKQKGAKDSLVMMGDMAFIVNVPSKTVVTAMSREQMKEQVFTNIDSTMFVGSESQGRDPES